MSVAAGSQSRVAACVKGGSRSADGVPASLSLCSCFYGGLFSAPRRGRQDYSILDASCSSQVARKSHNFEVTGSNPAPQPKKTGVDQPFIVLTTGFFHVPKPVFVRIKESVYCQLFTPTTQSIAIHSHRLLDT